MSRRVRVLPDQVANQIAAGEVVERPASVVKELVENALDAGASRVEITVEAGGKRLVRVADDGTGMIREDALLSLDRHATSKIIEAKDLNHLRTFGFRGEALPSIAAVSRLTLETRARSEPVGTRLGVATGTLTRVEDHVRARGTTVEVRRLFGNAPARAKFLKATAAETRAVAEAATVLALANPRVTFLLTSEGRTLLDLQATDDLRARVAELWGPHDAATLIPIDSRVGGVRVAGLIQRPDAAGPGFRRAYLFVNGRPFRDPALLRAADRGYRTTLPARARPWVFLFLQTEGPDVDVNVHPTKLEVRFRDRARIEECVEEAVRAGLAGEPSSATLGAGPGAEGGRPGDPAPPTGKASQASARLGPAGAGGSVVRETHGDGSGDPLDQMALFVTGESPAAAAATGAHGSPPVVAPPERPRLWQVHQTWILAETRDGILIIDQHSAHERVLYHELMEEFERGGRIGQRLLFPLTFRLSRAEIEQIGQLGGLLERSGFEVEPFGEDTVIVHSVPDPHPYFDAQRCFREMIAEMTEGSELTRSARNQHERIAMTFACKGAIKAGQNLNRREMEELFDRLFATELPHHDVHGRPTIVRLDRHELERKFGRA